LIHALIATEDIRFREHSGIDAKALLRASCQTGYLFSRRMREVAVRLHNSWQNNYIQRNWQQAQCNVCFRNLSNGLLQLSWNDIYTKQEILTMYLNKFDFLNNAVGIKTASYTYFGCEPKDLTIEESATLVGMCKNSSYFNPVRYNQRTRERRNVVLDQMRKAGYLSADACDSLQRLPLVLHYHRVDHKEGLATYFREYLRIMMTAHKPHRRDYASYDHQKYYEDSLAWETNPLYGWCEKNRKSDGSNYNLSILMV
jgi:penicillin-binding protein 1A